MIFIYLKVTSKKSVPKVSIFTFSNFSSLWRKLRLKMLLIVICKIFRLFVNTLTPDGKYFLFNCHNQSKSNCLKNKNIFLNFLLHFWNLHQILNNLKKWPSSNVIYFRNYRLSKTWLGQCLKSPITERPSTVWVWKCLC